MGRIAIFNTHDANGNIIHTEFYTYDVSENLIGISDNLGNRIQYTYDDSGNLTSLDFDIENKTQETVYFYNKFLDYDETEDGLQSSLYDKTTYTTQDNQSVTKEYFYQDNALYKLNYIELINGTFTITNNFTYSGDTTRITEISYNIDKTSNGSTADDIDIKYTYIYDNLGNITKEYYYEGTSLKLYRNYEYDDLNQLKVEHSRDYNYGLTILSATNFTKYYYYDSRGNRTDVKTFLYGKNDYNTYPIPSFYENSTGSTNVKVYYNGSNDCYDIYELQIGQTPNVTISLYNLDTGTWVTGIVFVNETYSNLDIYHEGYYYSYFTATYKTNVYTEFRIVYKVGNPIDGPIIPQEHTHYNYSLNWEDQLLSYGEIEYINGIPQTEATIQEYTYDSQGNPTEITNFVYNGTTYDRAYLSWSGRELSTITIMQGYSTPLYQIRYQYNDIGYRTQKAFYTYSGYTTILTQAIDYELIDDKVIYETDGTYGIIYTYDYNGTLISFNYDSDITDQNSGSEYFYIRNQMGDITHIATSDGTVVVHYIYDAYGNIVDTDFESGYSAIADINPYRYRGYRFDSEISMYYLNSRYYNPEVGRFINADGLLGKVGNLQTHNMYAYCGNNPVMYTDSDGDFPILILAIVALYTARAVHDVIEIVTEEVKFVEGTGGNGGQIENSYKVQNPSVVLGYSIYLRYFSEHKDCFDGSATGIAAEWMAHNVGYDLTVVTSVVGIGADWNKRAKHADIGRTIFNEEEWYVKYPSIAIEAILNPVAVIYDYFQYIHQSEGDGND